MGEENNGGENSCYSYYSPLAWLLSFIIYSCQFLTLTYKSDLIVATYRETYFRYMYLRKAVYIGLGIVIFNWRHTSRVLEHIRMKKINLCVFSYLRILYSDPVTP